MSEVSNTKVNLPVKKRGKRYTDIDVLTAAKARIRYLRDNFDTCVISFSGGKDSLAVLSLWEAVNAEDGIITPITVLFRDEEVINTSIVDFVKTLAESGRYNFKWMAYPMNVGMNLMGKYYPFTAWDPARRETWHREPPPYAITDLGVDTAHLDEFQVHKAELPFVGAMGRTCMVLGLRAAESIKRWMALTAKVENNYISVGPNGNATASPLFDWEEFDVFKWFYEGQIDYCPIYDAQMWVNTTLRVSSSLHDRAFEQLEKLAEAEPEYWHALRTALPELDAQVRYAKEVDYWGQAEGYPHTWEGLHKLIDDQVGDEFRKMAHDYVIAGEGMRRRNAGRLLLGGVPLRSMFSDVLKGKYWGGVVSVREAGPEDVLFESGN